MNHTYRLIWSAVQGCLVVVAENVSARGKASRAARKLLASVLLAATTTLATSLALSQQTPPASTALPQGGQVVSGQASIAQTGANMQVNQASQKAILNWQQFNIGSAASVNFSQPDAQSVALNRVVGGDASQIMGRLTANGQVFLINPNGVLFGQGAQVNVGAMTASTLNITDADFLAGNYRFTRDGAAGKIRNEGDIHASQGGYLALLSPDIYNSGTLVAQRGSVALAAGEAVTLSFNGSAVSVQVDPAQINAHISNHNLIEAEGGTVVMTAQAANALLEASINNTGIIKAGSLVSQGGEIRLVADHVANTGTINVDGTQGGRVAISARQHDAFGDISAQGSQTSGGMVTVESLRTVMLQSASINVDGVTDGGGIRLTHGQTGTGGAYLSGQLSADGSTGKGGEVDITGRNLDLFGTTISATGATAGGQLRVGGDYQGANATIPNAENLDVNAASFDVSATQNGQGGKAIFWSENQTQFGGSVDARGATNGVKATATGGLVEVSSRGELGFGGLVQANRLLLDPSVLNIIEPGLGFEITNFVDPDTAITGFGNTVFDTTNSNLLVLSPNQSAIGSGAGYVFQRDGTLVSALRDTGAVANWRSLGSSKYLITNPTAAGGVGAVSYFNAASPPTSGRMDSSNSLVGDATFGDAFGSNLYDLGGGYYGATIYTAGNGLASSILKKGAWNFFKADATGSNLVVGTVSASNSLVGATSGTANAQPPNNFSSWGSATRGDIIGFFAEANSNDLRNPNTPRSSTLKSLGSGNWVLGSPRWNNTAGAVTLISPQLIDNGNIKGVVSASNSIVGTAYGQQLGINLRADGLGGVGPTAYGNAGDYILNLQSYDGKGALVALNTNIINSQSLLGGLTSSNALLFGGTGDGDSSNLTVLSDNSLLITNTTWNSYKGYARSIPYNANFAQMITGSLAAVSASNSLIGNASQNSPSGYSGDLVGASVTDLGSGNFVVKSSFGGGTYTWSNGSSPTTGNISTAAKTISGANGLTALAGGASLVTSGSHFKYVAAAATPTSGLLSTVGTGHGGNLSITDLGSGNWAMLSDNAFGLGGTRSLLWGGSSNARSSITTADILQDAGSVFSLGGNDLLATLPGWNSNTGAIVRIDASNFTPPVISASTALVGSNAGDQIGSGGIFSLGNNRAVVLSPSWQGASGAAAETGAVTLVSAANAATRLQGSLSASNSLIGSAAGDSVGKAADLNAIGGAFVEPVQRLGSSNTYAVVSPYWSSNKGAVTLFDGPSGDLTGVIGASNSLVGRTPGDYVGRSGYYVGTSWSPIYYEIRSGNPEQEQASLTRFFDLGSGYFALRSSAWLANPGDTSSAGALTWINTNASLPVGVVDGSNSLVGAQAGDRVGLDAALRTTSTYNPQTGATTYFDTVPLFESIAPGVLALRNYYFDGAQGAMSVFNRTSAPVGAVSAANSLVNASGTTGVFAPDVSSFNSLGSGYALFTQKWNNNSGAITYIPTGSTPAGVISSTTSLVGTANQGLGGTSKLLNNGKLLIGSPLWNSSRGAATLLDNTNGLASTLLGTITLDGSNSFVGVNAGDRVGSGGFADLGNDIFVVYSPDFGISASPRTVFGAVTLGDSVTNALKGDVSSVNSFFSTTSGQSAATYISGQGQTGAVMSTGSEVGNIQVTQPVSTVNGGLAYADFGTRRVNMRPMTITAILDTGTDVTLQATDAINVYSPIVANNPSGNGGNLTLQTNGVNSAITIGSQGRINTDNGELTIISAGNFINNASATPFNTGTNRWTVYANDPSTSSLGNNLGFDFKEYGKSFGQTLDGRTALGALTNAVVFSTAPTLSVPTPSDYKTYDGTTALGTSYTISGLVDGDTVSVIAAYTSPHAGIFDPNTFVTSPSDIAVTIGAGGVKSSLATGSKPIYGYVNQNLVVPGTTTFTGAGQIDPFMLNVNLIGTVTKVYDGTDAGPAGYHYQFTTSSGSFNPNLNGGNGGFDPIPDAGLTMDSTGFSGKFYDYVNTYSATGRVTGHSSGAGANTFELDYNPSPNVLVPNGASYLASDYRAQLNNTSVPGTITPKPIAGGLTASNKVYDGTTAATISGSLSLSGVLQSSYNSTSGNSPDDVQISGSATVGAATFADANAGTGKTVTINLTGASLSGADAENYTISSTTATADITPKALSVSGSTVANKQYDGTNTATINVGTLSGFIGSETVTATGAGTFASVNVGNGINVATSYTLANGTNSGLASNYSLASETLTGNITPAWLAVIVGSLTGSTSKVYDGATAATLGAGNFLLSGWVNGDGTDVSVTETVGVFADKNVGTGKLVTVTLDGSDFSASTTNLSNYGLPTTASGNIGEITAKSLTAAYAGTNKTYNGNTTASVTGSSGDIISGDTVTFSQSAAFANKNVATGKTINVSSISLGGTDAGNYALQNTTATTTADITAKALTAAYTGSNKTYDATTSATVTGSSSDIVSGDTVTFGESATFANKNAGTGKTINVSSISLGGADAGNYALQSTSTTATADIATASLSVTGATAANKTYDATTTANVTGGSVSALGSDSVTLSTANATFANKNAATGKAVTTAYTLSGTDATNYTLAQASGLTADITAKALTASYSASNKTYDATTSATVSGSSSDVESGDTVTFSESAVFANKNAGNGKTINVSSISLGGTDAGNYALQSTSTTTTANITTASLNVTGASAANKMYDGTTAATVTGGTVSALGSDSVTLSAANATFANKNAGTGKAVTTAYTLSGTDAANYVLGQASGLTADITAKTVTAAYTGVNKVYDATTSAMVTGSLTGGISGDTITFSETAAFGDKNVGTGKAVTISGISLGGADAGNYALQSTTASTTANITPFALSISGITANNKIYDATTSAVLSGTASLFGVLLSDVVSVNGTANGVFADKNAGTGKSIVVSGLSLSGTDAANYTVGALSATADITAKNLTASYSGTNKVYDAATGATVTGSSTDILSGDTVTFSQSAAFANKNVATGKTVNVSSISLGGTDAGNYALQNTTTTTTADITAKALTAAYTGTNKTYDATTSTTVTGSSGDILSGDTVTFSESAVFANKNAGTGKTINVSSISLGGTDAGNYALQSTSTTATADITAASLSVTGASAANKTYDAATTAAVTGGTVSALGSDSVTLSAANATFANKNVGTGKSVTTAYTLSGTDAANYTVGQASGLTADITTATLNVTGATAANKTYDATTAATVTGGTVSALGSDSITLSAANASFANKNVGTSKSVTTAYTLSGTDAANYTVGQASGLTADITTATLNVTGATAANKTYDATTAATVTGGTVSALGSDSITLSAANATFANKNVGTGKAVTTAYTLSGADATNYTVGQASGLTADITQASLTVAGASAANKTYDGTTTASVTGGSVTALGSDSFTLTAGSAAFADKNVGLSKTVAITFTLSGTDAANYALVQPNLSADITPKSLTVSGLAASNKTYDATDAVTISNWGAISTGVGSETLVLNHGSATFSNANAGNGKTVTAIGYSLADGSNGGLANNYQLSASTATTTANITPASLTMTAQNASKAFSDADPTLTAVYSGFVGSETSAALPGISVTRVAGESAGTYAITPSATATNYTITPVAGTFTIAPADQLVIQLGNINTVYGGAPTFGVTSAKYYSSTGSTLRTLSVSQSGNVFTVDDGLGTTASFSIAATGAGTSTAGYYRAGNHTLGGTGFQLLTGSNFNSSNFSSGNLNISRLVVDLSDSANTGTPDAGSSTVRRDYDGTTNTTLQSLANIDNLLTGDLVTLDTSNATGSYADAHAGNGKLATFTGMILAGADADNYAFGGTLLAEGKIDPRTLTWTGATIQNKTYDTTTNATVTGNGVLGNVVTADLGQVALDTNSIGAAFALKDAGTQMAVSVWGNLTGSASGDYTVSGTTAYADVARALLSVTGGSAANKVYDGTTAATVTGGSVTALAGDGITLSAANATFANKHVGTGKAVTTAYTLSGTDAANYALAQAAGLTANITAKPLTAMYAAANKFYDGTTAATATGTSTDILGVDQVTFSHNANFRDPIVGAGKTVDILNVLLGGADAANYALQNSSATATADILAVASNTGAIGSQLLQNTVNSGTTSPSSGTATGTVPAGSPTQSLTPQTGALQSGGPIYTPQTGGTVTGTALIQSGTPVLPGAIAIPSGGTGSTAPTGTSTPSGTPTGASAGTTSATGITANTGTTTSTTGTPTATVSTSLASTAQTQSGVSISNLASNSDTGFISVRPLGSMQLVPGRPSTFQVTPDTFEHSLESGFRLEARQLDGSPLPAWIRFEPSTGVFDIQPPNGLTQEIAVVVVAFDTRGNTASTSLNLKIQAN